MIFVWNLLTVFGFAVMFLLLGILVLFLVSTIYHLVAARKKKALKEKSAGFPSNTLSKAA